MPLITQMRTDGWRSYQVAAKELEIVHHRAILERPEGFDEAAVVDAPVDRQCQSGYIRPSPVGIGKNIFNGT